MITTLTIKVIILVIFLNMTTSVILGFNYNVLDYLYFKIIINL